MAVNVLLLRSVRASWLSMQEVDILLLPRVYYIFSMDIDYLYHSPGDRNFRSVKFFLAIINRVAIY